jgi:aspartate 4-decarboxylase
VIATHQQNILEQQLSDLSAEEKQRLELRYGRQPVAPKYFEKE